jgi:hypothetical protein
MTLDSLTRPRHSKARTHHQQSATSQKELYQAVTPLGLREPLARFSRTDLWRARITGSAQATARWAAVSAGVVAVHFAAWRFLFFP